MEFTTFKCDGCGRIKQESNHWWQFASLPGPQIFVFAWDSRVALGLDAKVLHLCSEACVTKAVLGAMVPVRVSAQRTEEE
jgi:hypothetical protein